MRASATARLALLVADCFGPAFRGDGPSAGQLAMIIRLPGGPAHTRKLEVGGLVDWVTSGPARLVVVTGGEPLRQYDGLLALASGLAERGYRVEIATTGAVVPGPELLAATHLFVVSPRLEGINDDALAAFVDSGRAVFHAAVRTVDDLARLDELEQRLGLYPIWLAPHPAAEPTAARRLADHARDRGWNLSPRVQLHYPQQPGT